MRKDKKNSPLGEFFLLSELNADALSWVSKVAQQTNKLRICCVINGFVAIGINSICQRLSRNSSKSGCWAQKPSQPCLMPA